MTSGEDLPRWAGRLPIAPVVDLVAPVPVQYTPEVAAAKVTPMAAVDAVGTGVVALVADLPIPVQDTPEVAAAKAEHAAKFTAAKTASAAAPVSRRKRIDRIDRNENRIFFMNTNQSESLLSQVLTKCYIRKKFDYRGQI